MNISTKTIQKALSYYESKGYNMIDIPLVVDQKVSEHTKPIGVPDLHHINSKVYVASAEQSFLQLHKDGNLSDGKYMALSPCYRHERFLDDTHYLMFLKLELIVVGLYKKNPLCEMVGDCERFFREQLDPSIILEGKVTFGDELDITCKGIELGSYGKRKMIDGTPYYYGTGLAEPRLSYVRSLINENGN